MPSKKPSHLYSIAPGVSVARYEELIGAAPPNRRELSQMVRRRFEARFIEPVTDFEPLTKKRRVRGGFAALALCCLGIQALQSFRSRKDKSDTAADLKKFIRDNNEFSALRSHERGFYDNIRNALHHQAQTRGGWRINKSGPVFDLSSLSIGAQKFVDGFLAALDRYCTELEKTTDESELWKSFLIKMKYIVKSCDAEPGPKKK